MNDTWKRQCYRKIVKWLCFYFIGKKRTLAGCQSPFFLYGEVEKSHPKPKQRVVRVGKRWSSSEKAHPKPMQRVVRVDKGWSSSGKTP